MYMPSYRSGGHRTTCESWFSLTMCHSVLSQVSRLGSRHFTCWSTSPAWLGIFNLLFVSFICHVCCPLSRWMPWVPTATTLTQATSVAWACCDPKVWFSAFILLLLPVAMALSLSHLLPWHSHSPTCCHITLIADPPMCSVNCSGDPAPTWIPVLAVTKPPPVSHIPALLNHLWV